MFEWVNKNGMLMSQALYCALGHTCHGVGWEHGCYIISAILFPQKFGKILSAVISACHKSLSNSGGRV